jgi:predicted site-specific integrase-resolvase
MENKEKNYRIGDFADLLGVSVKTLQRWDRNGILKAKRTATDRRYYTHSQYLDYIQTEADIGSKDNAVIYARVSDSSQEVELNNQIDFLKTFAKSQNINVTEVIVDVGSGIDFNRKNWNRLMDLLLERKIGKILVTSKDRFSRLGFEWFERLAKKCDTQIMVVNDSSFSKNGEVLEDISAMLNEASIDIADLKAYKKMC